MKHNIKSIFFLLLSVGVVSSCSKTIDLNPSYTVNGDESFTTIADYEAALTGVYARLRANSYYGSTLGSNAFVGLPDIMSDNFYETSESLANYTSFKRWSYTADDTYIEDTWLDAYTVVQQANLTIRGIDKLAATNAGAVNRIMGQALALRALAHFDIFRYFGEEFGRNSAKLGIPYVQVYDIEQKPARLTIKETYDKIEQDLKTAKSLLSNTDRSIQSLTSTAGTARAYVDSLVVNAMLARMYNYSGESDSAIKYATYVIDARPLATITEFPLLWQSASTAEVIWSVKFENNNDDIGGNIYYATGDRASYRPTSNLIALYNTGTDVRYTSYFQDLGRLVLTKYLAKQAQVDRPDGKVDFQVFRTGEMYLIRAEAYALKGNGVAALDDLNVLRTTRGIADGSETGSALTTAIFTERRKELVAEGQRFFDLKRTTRTINRTTNCTTFCTLLPSDREWSFPIPQSEITANRNIKQNPGY